jgi:hypothetical protein
VCYPTTYQKVTSYEDSASAYRVRTRKLQVGASALLIFFFFHILTDLVLLPVAVVPAVLLGGVLVSGSSVSVLPAVPLALPVGVAGLASGGVGSVCVNNTNMYDSENQHKCE